jgi:tRNA-specific 2-thiouridylase
VVLEEVNWLADPLQPGDHCSVQVRYRSRAIPASVSQVTGRLTLTLDSPARAITPGQSGVLYRGEMVLGGGVIASE